MDRTDITNSLDTLEELLMDSKSFEVITPKINIKKLVNKVERCSYQKSSSTSSDSSFINDSITIGEIHVPSEIWNNMTPNVSSSQSFYNVANRSNLSQKSSRSNIESLINIKDIST